MSSRRALLVEGFLDTLLFKGLLAAIGMNDVDVFPPRDLGASSDGISQVLKLLPVLISKIQNSELDNVGILVDADYAANGSGFAKRIQEISDALRGHGYAIQPPLVGQIGNRYKHPTLVPIDLLIVPDHASDGMIEDVLVASVSPGDQTNLLVHAKSSIDTLPVALFDIAAHKSKAEVATLMAWQKSPGCEPGIAIRKGAFNLAAPKLLSVTNWLKATFP